MSLVVKVVVSSNEGKSAWDLNSVVGISLSASSSKKIVKMKIVCTD